MIGVFYYSLCNIHSALRSSICSIQLLAVAKTVDVWKYGSQCLLESFTESMNILGSVSLRILTITIIIIIIYFRRRDIVLSFLMEKM